jgi:hypothetical protein
MVGPKPQGQNSQKFLRQICKSFVTLGLKISRLLRTKVFKADINKNCCYLNVTIIKYLFSMHNCCIKALKKYENFTNYPYEVL